MRAAPSVSEITVSTVLHEASMFVRDFITLSTVYMASMCGFLVSGSTVGVLPLFLLWRGFFVARHFFCFVKVVLVFREKVSI